MRKCILLVLPLAALFLMAGCDEYQSSSGGYTAPATASQSAPAQQQPAPSYQTSRNSTTQPLPAGWGYLHEQDLSGGRLPASSQPTTVARGGS